MAADEAEIRLVSSVSAVAPEEKRLSLGLWVRLSEGWRIYWRTPGAAGLPPQFDWSGSENLAAAEVSWPAPLRFTAFGQQSYGYTGEVLFPILARLETEGAPLSLSLSLTYLVCREVCIPGEADLDLVLPAGPAAATSAAPTIAAARSALPRPASAAGVEIRAIAAPGGLVVQARSATAFSAPDLFLEWPISPGQRRPDLPRPRLSLAEGGHAATFDLTLHPPLVRPGTVLTVTLTDPGRAVEASVTVEPAP